MMHHLHLDDVPKGWCANTWQNRMVTLRVKGKQDIYSVISTFLQSLTSLLFYIPLFLRGEVDSR